MTPTQLECVVDASVGIKLFINELLSDKADALFTHLAGEPSALLAVPDLFYIECANILWKQVQRFGYPASDAQKDLASLAKLALHSVPTLALMSEALKIAVAQGITAYDACYLALAHRLGVPFITADDKLVRVLAPAPYDIRWLGDFDVPPPVLS
jgi:predicted nucleic acid-binding protein